MATTRTPITVTKQMYDAWLSYSQKEQRSMAWIAREALADFLMGKEYHLQDIHPPTRGGRREKSGRKPG